MYIYNLCQEGLYSLDLYLIPEKEFSQEEFMKMCEEVEVKYKDSHAFLVCNYLREKYGFKGIGNYIVGYYEYKN